MNKLHQIMKADAKSIVGSLLADELAEDERRLSQVRKRFGRHLRDGKRVLVQRGLRGIWKRPGERSKG